MTPIDRSNPFRAEIEALRSRASGHPVLVELQDLLPAHRDGERMAPGLYIDAKAAPGIKVNREYRVSVARIYSVGDDGRPALVGQCQVTAHQLPSGRAWRVRWYVHAPKRFWSEQVDDVQDWWLRVLEQHLERGGEPPEVPVAVEA